MNKAAIAISVLLLSACAGLAFAMHRGNRSGIFARTVFRIKTLRVFPARALTYAVFAAAILFFGLLAAEGVIGSGKDMTEGRTAGRIYYERFHASEAGYYLMTMKDREIPPREHPRILVVGDSFVIGDGLTNVNQIWWSVMASELERRDYDCEVYAAGAAYTSTYDELVWLRDSTLLEDMRPDLIVIGYVFNDPDLISAGLELPVYYPEKWLDPAYASHGPAKTVCPNLYYLAEAKLVEKRSRTENRFNNGEYGYTWLGVAREYAQSPYRETFDDLAVRPLGKFTAQLGIPVIVIPTPESPNRWLYETHYQSLMPLFEGAGLPVYNPFEGFVEYCAGDSRVMKHLHADLFNPHPGPSTSWFLGNYAADVVEREYASILGEKRAEGKAYPIEINDWMPYRLGLRVTRESGQAAPYTIEMEYPEQSSHDSFLTWPLREKHVKLNFKYPVRISSVNIEGEDLLSAQVWTLGINETLGFDDQKPLKWPRGSGRRATSLLISAKTVDGKQAALTVTIEGEVVF